MKIGLMLSVRLKVSYHTNIFIQAKHDVSLIHSKLKNIWFQYKYNQYLFGKPTVQNLFGFIYDSLLVNRSQVIAKEESPGFPTDYLLYLFINAQ